MLAITQFLFHTELGHFVIAVVLITAVQSMDAPTKDSGPFYKWTFRFLNGLVLQFKRINPKVEDSPNFVDAVKQAPKP